VRAIALRIKRAASTVSREVNRNGGVGRYRASDADGKAWDRARRPKKCLLATNRKLRSIVAAKLSLQWSPQQIAGWLKTEFPENPELHVSHETIYRTLFVQARGALKKQLQRHLRSGRVMRHARTATRKGQTRYQIVDAVSIRERPPEVEDRSVPGHWEGDLLCGAHNTHIATLVERQSRFTVLVKVPRKDAPSVAKAMSRQVRKLPALLRRSVTFDRGPEFAAHKRFSVAADVKVYFCDPKSPWQRGTNENTNRLLRQYFPDGTDLSQFSQADLNRIALRLNRRPRKILQYETPAGKLDEVLR
jgi:IS30 family transposase